MGNTEAALFATVRNHVGHLAVSVSRMQMVALAHRLHTQLNEWEQCESVLAVVLRLTPTHSHDDDEGSPKQSLAEAERELAVQIAQYPKPILALLDGALSAGSMWLQQATLRAITEGTTLEVQRRMSSGSQEGPQSLAVLQPALSRYLEITQRLLRPADALYAGLADYCLPIEMVAEFDRCLDGMSWNTHPREALRTLLATVAMRKMPGAELQALRLAIDEHFVFDSVETIRASLERESRPAYQDWADETLALLDSQCQHAPRRLTPRRQVRADA